MPNIVTFDKMQVGKKGEGKHWTKKEVESRKKAAQGLKRKGAIKLIPPVHIKNDLNAYAIWEKAIKDAKDLELLDKLDTRTLATWCKLQADMDKAIYDDDVLLHEKLSRTALTYAKTLGFTAESRAKLAKKKADKVIDPNAEMFGD